MQRVLGYVTRCVQASERVWLAVGGMRMSGCARWVVWHVCVGGG